MSVVVRGALPRRFAAACAAALAIGLAVTGVEAAAPGAPTPDDLTRLSIEELMRLEVGAVLGASRFVQRDLDAPTRASVITAEDLHAYGFETLAEALRSVNGLFVTNDRNYEYVGLRGWGHQDDYNARVLVLVDDHRLNDNLYEGAGIGEDFPLDLDQVDRIEIIRGPTSVLYGSNALLGVINVVTRRPKQTNGVETRLRLGSAGTRTARLGWSRRLSPSSGFQIAISGVAIDGFDRLYYREFDDPLTNGGVAEGLDGEEAQRVFADLQAGSFRLQSVLGTRLKDVPTAPWGTRFNAGNSWTRDVRGFVDLSYHGTLARRVDVSARTYVDDYRYDGAYPYDYTGTNTGPITVNRDRSLAKWWGAEANAHGTMFGPNDVVIGGEVRENDRQDQMNWDVDPYSLYLDDHRRSRVWAVYAECALHPLSRVTLDAGVRHDAYSTFGGSTHPRLGLIWELRDQTVVKLLHGSAFRVPTTYELYFGGDGYTANPDLKPERFFSSEVVLESYFAGHYHASLSAFRGRGEDVIRQRDVAGEQEYFNTGVVTSSGVEAEILGRWTESELRLSGALQSPLEAEDGRALPNSPERVAQLSVRAPVVPRRVWIACAARSLGRRINGRSERAAGFVVADANLTARLPSGRWSAAISVRNLFDAEYSDIGGPELTQTAVPQDGRTLRVRLDARF